MFQVIVSAIVYFVLAATSGSAIESSRVLEDVPLVEVMGSPSPLPAPSSEASTTVRQSATFLRVIDGDTIEVSVAGKKEKVRIIGVNTPETVDPRRDAECFGQEASNYAKLFFSEGANVQLQADMTQSDRDKYQRLLRYVFLDDVDYGKSALEFGYANEYTYGVPYVYREEYRVAERQARDNKRGLWADEACVMSKISSPTPVIDFPTQPVKEGEHAPSLNCSSPDKDCGDFSSRAQLMQFWNGCGFSASNDPHQLDGDNDGEACESL